MKRIGLFLMCLLCAPYVAHAADHCTNPDEYTVDKRCYVTDEQKQEKPYNAVVGVSVDGDYSINCTGTIVKNGDEFFLYTAKHCVAKKDSNGIIKNKVRIKFQNGKETIVEFVVAGDKGNRWDSDWVVYRLLPNYVTENLFGKVRYRANENMEDTIDYVYADDNGFCDGRHVTSVGYGSLKIMSDKDIEKFKQRYLNYLERKGITLTDENRLENGISHDGNTVLNTSEGLVDKFIHGFIREVFYTGWIFDDSKLKLSKCTFDSCNRVTCQSWFGDSGGPMFDDENRLVGMHISGFDDIGGEYHAQSGYNVPTNRIYQEMNELNLGPGLVYVEKSKK